MCLSNVPTRMTDKTLAPSSPRCHWPSGSSYSSESQQQCTRTSRIATKASLTPTTLTFAHPFWIKPESNPVFCSIGQSSTFSNPSIISPLTTVSRRGNFPPNTPSARGLISCYTGPWRIWLRSPSRSKRCVYFYPYFVPKGNPDPDREL